MDNLKLAAVQKIVSSSPSLIHEFARADLTKRTSLLAEVNTSNSIGFTTLEIHELSENPDQLLSGIELSDEDLAAVAGAGKGDSDISIGGNVNHSEISSSGGNTSTSANTSGSLSK